MAQASQQKQTPPMPETKEAEGADSLFAALSSFAVTAESDFHLIRDSGVLLRVQILLRWLAICGQSVAVMVVTAILGFGLPLWEISGLIGLSVALNIWLGVRHPVHHRLSVRAAGGFFAYDLLQLVGLLYFTGGLSNPFCVLILAPVTVSATVLKARATLFLVGLATCCVIGLSFFHQPLPWHDMPPVLPALYIFAIASALLLGMGFIASYVWRISHEGRRMTAATAALQQVLAREHHLSALDGFAAAAAHQLGTPLGTIGLIAAELQASDLAKGAHGEDLDTLRHEAQRCGEILAALTADGHHSDKVFSQMKLSALIDDVIHEAGDPAMPIKRDMNLGGADEPQMRRQPEIIYGLGNLLENAAHFARTHIVLSVAVDDTHITIKIADDGAGFAPDILARLGEPWLTSRPRNKRGGDFQQGMGLGFFIAKTMLERTGASVQASNKPPPETGAVILVRWPRAAVEMESAS